MDINQQCHPGSINMLCSFYTFKQSHKLEGDLVHEIIHMQLSYKCIARNESYMSIYDVSLKFPTIKMKQ